MNRFLQLYGQTLVRTAVLVPMLYLVFQIGWALVTGQNLGNPADKTFWFMFATACAVTSLVLVNTGQAQPVQRRQRHGQNAQQARQAAQNAIHQANRRAQQFGAWAAPRAAQAAQAAGRQGHAAALWARANPHDAAVALFALGAAGMLVAGMWTGKLRHWEMFSVLMVATVLAVIYRQNGGNHFTQNWKAYWLGLSLVGVAHTHTFDRNGTEMFIVSAILAGITLLGAWEDIRDTLLNKRGRIPAVLAWLGILFLVFMVYALAGYPHKKSFGYGTFYVTRGDMAYTFGGMAMLFFALALGFAGARFVRAVWRRF